MNLLLGPVMHSSKFRFATAIVAVSLLVVCLVWAYVKHSISESKPTTAIATGVDTNPQWVFLMEDEVPRVGCVVQTDSAEMTRLIIDSSVVIESSTSNIKSLYVDGDLVDPPQSGLTLMVYLSPGRWSEVDFSEEEVNDLMKGARGLPSPEDLLRFLDAAIARAKREL